MIIDSHVHIGSIGRFDMKPEYVIDSMERYGIDYSLVSSIAGVECNEDHTPLPENWAYDQLNTNAEAQGAEIPPVLFHASHHRAANRAVS